jgi:hypothetical protein
MSSAIHAGPWVGVKQAAIEVGVSPATLYRLREQGRLTAGVHFLKTTPGRTARTLWNPSTIREAMAGWSVDTEAVEG